jgi:hypothetical protein
MLHLRSPPHLYRDAAIELPAIFQTLDEGTQGYICDLLRQLAEAHRDLDRAQTDQVIVRGC